MTACLLIKLLIEYLLISNIKMFIISKLFILYQAFVLQLFNSENLSFYSVGKHLANTLFLSNLSLLRM